MRLQLEHRLQRAARPLQQSVRGQDSRDRGPPSRTSNPRPIFVGLVRGATTRRSSNCTLSGGSQWFSSLTYVSKKCQVRRAQRRKFAPRGSQAARRPPLAAAKSARRPTARQSTRAIAATSTARARDKMRQTTPRQRTRQADRPKASDSNQSGPARNSVPLRWIPSIPAACGAKCEGDRVPEQSRRDCTTPYMAA